MTVERCPFGLIDNKMDGLLMLAIEKVTFNDITMQHGENRSRRLWIGYIMWWCRDN